MAEKSYSCDVKQGFEFTQDVQTPVGFIMSAKIGDKDLKADFTDVISPEDGKKTIKVVGVMSGVYFPGGKSDPISFGFNISTANKVTCQSMLDSGLTNVAVEICWEVWDYDPDKKAYYKCFHTNDEKLKGLVTKNGGVFVFSVSGEADGQVRNPLNFATELAVTPANVAQALQYANSSSAKATMPWGIKEG